MKIARIQVVIGFFLTVATIVTYKVITTELVDPNLKEAQIAYETEKVQFERAQLKRADALESERLRVKQTTLQRDNLLSFYGTLGLFSACGLAVLILALGYSRAQVKRAAVHIARIGQHSEIPIHQKDLHNFYPIAVNLSLAEIEASTSSAHEKAYHISRQMIEDITDYTRALTGKRSLLALGSGAHDQNCIDISAYTATPTFAELLRNETIAFGKPLIIGYDRQGQPQYRTLQDLKSLAVAGWQGSGKTISMGYIVASSILAYGVHAYIVDPHKHHPESLCTLIKSLEPTGHVTIINPFDTPELIQMLHGILDRRLNGEEPSEPGILLVIDEMARLAKMECFDVLITFLERCTEETRKANITFIGGSNKWTARHFKGRADIRGCMNSMLIHKMKPSQADLLLEDAHDKNLVKQLHRPGEAILATDYATPQLVTMPLCTLADIKTVAEVIKKTAQLKLTGQPFKASALSTPALDFSIQMGPTEPCKTGEASVQESPVKIPHSHPQQGTGSSSELAQGKSDLVTPPKAKKPIIQRTLSDVIPFEVHFHRKRGRQISPAPIPLTVERIKAQVQQLKERDPRLTQSEIARQAGLSPGHFSQILSGKRPLHKKNAQKLYAVLFHQSEIEIPAAQT